MDANIGTAFDRARRRRFGAGAVLTLAVTVLVPAVAQAHTGVKFNGDRMIIDGAGGPGEPDKQDIRIEIDPLNSTRVLIRDLGPDGLVGPSGEEAKDNCLWSANMKEMRCPRSLFSRIQINAGVGEDRISVASNITVPVEQNGGIGHDTLNGGGGPNNLNGEAGNDTLIGGARGDRINGGGDTDLLSYASRSGPVTVNLTRSDGQGAPGENDTAFNIENVATGAGADSIFTKNGRPNAVSCGAGKDEVVSDSTFTDSVADDCEQIERIDKTAPTAKLKVKSRDIDRIVVSVLPSEDVTITIRTRASFHVGAAKTLRFKTTKRKLEGGTRKKIRLRISRKRKKAIEKALHKGRKVKARIRLTLTDAAGNKTVKTKKIRLKD
jgi:hypothetical protein